MIVNHAHKFIFVKTEKTAGTSIEIGLSKFCSEQDVVTKIAVEDEKTRKELTLVNAKGDIRKDSRHYSKVLNAESRAMIEKACAREIEEFGYQWRTA